jgi:uncharacterized protein YutE (UPF0331/DUF86 family)
MEMKKPEDFGIFLNKLDIDVTSNRKVESPFGLTAEECIDFANEDIKGDSKKDIVNAISNTKRAIENRVDHLLFAFGFLNLVKKGDFPDKLELLNEIGIIAPKILRKVNKIRNLLEHQYKVPNKGEVEDAIDVALLFLEATRKYIYYFIDECGLYDEERRISMEFNDKREMVIEIISRTSNKIENLSLSYKQAAFVDWLKLFIYMGYYSGK